MLKNIPKQLSGALLHAMCDMGHGSELILADANFPAVDCVPTDRIIFLPSVGNAELLESVLTLFPLDSYGSNVVLMSPEPPHKEPAVWEDYERVLLSACANHKIARLSRDDFYRRARSAYCVVVSGEGSPYANIILKKGEVRV